MHALRIVVFAALYSLLETSNAETTVAHYRVAVRDGGLHAEVQQVYVVGLGRGLWIANYRGKIFCLPEGFIAQGTDFLQWLDKEIEDNPTVTPDSYIELVLLAAMIRKFPCAKE
jgi:hypothetical protein